MTMKKTQKKRNNKFNKYPLSLLALANKAFLWQFFSFLFFFLNKCRKITQEKQKKNIEITYSNKKI